MKNLQKLLTLFTIFSINLYAGDITVNSVFEDGASEERTLTQTTAPLTEKPKTVITFGTFDLFHVGHLNILERAKRLGDRLIVGVSTDEFSQRRKSRFPIFNEKDRFEIVRACRCVDEVFYETDYDQKPAFIDEYNADILVLGDDWTGKFDGIHPTCRIMYLPRTDGISSTDTIAKIEGQVLVLGTEKATAAATEYVTKPGSPGRALGFYQMMKDIHDAFAANEATYVSIAGTLLGAVRHKGFIPWDNDIDIAVFEERMAGVDRAIDILAFLGYRVERDHITLKISSPSCCTDIVVYEKTMKTKYLDRSLVFPITQTKFGAVSINIPSQAEKMLERTYGESWSASVSKWGLNTLDRDRAPAEQATEFLPLGPFGPLEDRVETLLSTAEFVPNLNLASLVIDGFLKERIYNCANGTFILDKGYDFIEHKNGGRWLIDGEVSLIFKPQNEYQVYFVNFFGYPYKPNNSEEWIVTCMDGDKPVNVACDDKGLTVFLSGSHERALTLKMSCSSPKNFGSTDERNLSFFLKNVQIFGGNPF